MSEAERLVERQLAAYNARDLEAFVAVYSEDVEVYRLPSLEPVLSGRAAFAAHYAARRFHMASLHAEILQRIVLGNKVIDHERVSADGEATREVIAAYEIRGGFIARVWFLAPE